MQTKFMKGAVAGMAGAVAMMAPTGAAQAAAFEGRNASNAVDTTCTSWGTDKCVSFYNATLDITILNNWSIGQGPWNVAAAPGSAQAIAAGAGLAATGLTGWVLPTANQYGSIMTQVGGRFLDLRNQFDGVWFGGGGYWSSTEYAPDPSQAWIFVTISGTQGGTWGLFHSFHEAGNINAVAVRLGDVAVVPELGTGAMMLLALGAFAVAVRPRPR